MRQVDVWASKQHAAAVLGLFADTRKALLAALFPTLLWALTVPQMQHTTTVAVALPLTLAEHSHL